MRGRWFLILAVGTVGLLFVMRTSRTPSPLLPIEEDVPIAAGLGQSHDPSRCGSLVCQVNWVGEVPAVKPLSLFQAKVRPGGLIELPNPNAPRVGKNGGLADVIVFLRGIDLKQSRPWDLPAVQVEATERDFVVLQGDRRGRMGVVRRGGEVEFVSRDASMQSARARGAAFFQQMLFDKDQPVERTFAHSGIVELSSGSGHFWMRGYLAVSDHPYVGITDDKGQVSFGAVPAGKYELVCWKANWRIARIDRDPEWLFQASLDYAPPIEKRQTIEIAPGNATRSSFQFETHDAAAKN